MKFQYDGKILLCDFFFSITFVEGMFFIYEETKILQKLRITQIKYVIFIENFIILILLFCCQLSIKCCFFIIPNIVYYNYRMN